MRVCMHVWSGHSLAPQGMRTEHSQSEKTTTVPFKTKGLCGSANLISHPVRALLPQAQRRRDKTQQFVHILIAYPPAEKERHVQEVRSQVISLRPSIIVC